MTNNCPSCSTTGSATACCLLPTDLPATACNMVMDMGPSLVTACYCLPPPACYLRLRYLQRADGRQRGQGHGPQRAERGRHRLQQPRGGGGAAQAVPVHLLPNKVRVWVCVWEAVAWLQQPRGRGSAAQAVPVHLLPKQVRGCVWGGERGGAAAFP